MVKVLKLNSISPKVNDVLDKNYEITSECDNPELILVRSAQMADYALPESVVAIGRAGAGVNNIPHAEYAKRGVVVFNSPGANANAVKELVITALLLSCRKIIEGIKWVNSQNDAEGGVAKIVEKGKAQFVGGEISGKTLGVVGLGAIGRKVAVAANALGMNIVGYDPFFNKDTDLGIDLEVVDTLDKIYEKSDFITLHLPYNADTKGMIDKVAISKMKDGVVIVNCARGELVQNDDIIAAVKDGKVHKYFTDFPSEPLLNVDGIIACPHLGASTPEAEDNCAVMVATELKDYFENGNIKNSVNYPAVFAARKNHRITVLAEDNPAVSSLIADFADKNDGKVTCSGKNGNIYAIIDSDNEFSSDSVAKLAAAREVYRVREII
ncbi:MAG: 3-phosphoglycerate dehydrogenase [Eubacteriales bacterium]|nr:3-phosphoglycerate dehydrogenase [Eubacteriales bacterium]